jgi:hypothetical protein
MRMTRCGSSSDSRQRSRSSPSPPLAAAAMDCHGQWPRAAGADSCPTHLTLGQDATRGGRTFLFLLTLRRNCPADCPHNGTRRGSALWTFRERRNPAGRRKSIRDRLWESRLESRTAELILPAGAGGPIWWLQSWSQPHGPRRHARLVGKERREWFWRVRGPYGRQRWIRASDLRAKEGG